MAEPGRGRRGAGRGSGSAPAVRSPWCWLSPPRGCRRSARTMPSGWPSASARGAKGTSGELPRLSAAPVTPEPPHLAAGSAGTAADSSPAKAIPSWAAQRDSSVQPSGPGAGTTQPGEVGVQTPKNRGVHGIRASLRLEKPSESIESIPPPAAPWPPLSRVPECHIHQGLLRPLPEP